MLRFYRCPFNIYGLSKGDFVRCTLVIDIKYGILRESIPTRLRQRKLLKEIN